MRPAATTGDAAEDELDHVAEDEYRREEPDDRVAHGQRRVHRVQVLVRVQRLGQCVGQEHGSSMADHPARRGITAPRPRRGMHGRRGGFGRDDPGPSLARGSDGRAGVYLKSPTAREITSAMVTSEMQDCASIVSFAHRASGITSVGLKAVALVNDMYR